MRNKVFITMLSICIIVACIYGAKTKLNYKEEKVYSQTKVVEADNKQDEDDINVNSDENKKTSKNNISKKEAREIAKDILINYCNVKFNEEEYDEKITLGNSNEDYIWNIKWAHKEKLKGYYISINAKTGEANHIGAGYDIVPGDPVYKGSKEELYKIIDPLMKKLNINIDDYYINMDPAYNEGRNVWGRTIFKSKKDKNKGFVVAIEPNEKRVMEYYKGYTEVKKDE